MCGIAGIVRPRPEAPVEEAALLRMAAAVRHRGPDGFGLARGEGAGLVSARLAIFDIPGGWQPSRVAGGSGIVVYNGEVYNHPELRAGLERDGARFNTTCDTEVVHALLERDGLGALDSLNGQFAFAWWQPGLRRLTLVRDRFGVRPLHYALLADGSIVFGSEAKALFASGEIGAEPDPGGLDEVFTLWGAIAPRTPFRGVSQVPPGSLVVWEEGRVTDARRWWSDEEAKTAAAGNGDAGLEELLRDSVRLRLRADVPVGTYLSGGLDSSLITALAQQERGGDVRSFSIAFSEPGYDERAHQEAVAAALGTDHHALEVSLSQIAAALPEVIWHTETPLIRTAPVPLFLLAQEVRDQKITVVATGEGADEVFWGYDLFKEVTIRELYERDPERALSLLDGLYAHLGDQGRRGAAWHRAFLDAASPGDPLESHLSRAAATGAVKALFSAEMREAAGNAALDQLRSELPAAVLAATPLERAGWLERKTLLEPYLLSAQADRVSMAHGVEGRFPFLDHRVFSVASRLPPERKLDGMRDKAVLRDLARRVLPESIANRVKQPYRAPEVQPFFGEGAPGWVEELLSERALCETGFWDPRRVAGLVRRCRAGRARGVREGMALIGVLTTQLWHRSYFGDGRPGFPAESAEPNVRMDLSKTTETEGS